MAKIRVYELAKELQMENKVLVDLIRETGDRNQKSFFVPD